MHIEFISFDLEENNPPSRPIPSSLDVASYENFSRMGIIFPAGPVVCSIHLASAVLIKPPGSSEGRVSKRDSTTMI
jgi:hypothetical protein